MPSAGLGKGAPLSLPAIVPLIRITPASTAELTSATVRKIAVIRLILLMLFIILIFFLVLAFGDFSLLRTQFRPFTGVLGRIWRFVTRKNRNFKNHGLHGYPGYGKTQKTEGNVANVVPNQVRSESSLFPLLSSVRKEAIDAGRPTHLCDRRNPWSDYFGTREATILDTNFTNRHELKQKSCD